MRRFISAFALTASLLGASVALPSTAQADTISVSSYTPTQGEVVRLPGRGRARDAHGQPLRWPGVDRWVTLLAGPEPAGLREHRITPRANLTTSSESHSEGHYPNKADAGRCIDV